MHPLVRSLAAAAGFLTLLIGVIAPAAAQDAVKKDAAAWHFERDERDHPSLAYQQGEKVIFYIGVGRAVGLWIAYPGPPQPDGATAITIKTSSRTWTMKGELANDHDFNRGDAPATYFLQWDMGLSRPKPEFDNLTRIYNAFIDSLVASKQIVIVTKAGTVTLPRIDVKDVRTDMRI